jgi:zinc/manganese transport system permease protein
VIPDLLWLPFLACLVLTGIHVYLGLHVLARGVIFVDLALAQIAALGITAAFLAGHPIGSPAAYWYALAFAVCGGLVFALTRVSAAPIPQEAIIGIVYAVSAAAAVLVVDRAPQGGEHIKQLLVGSILTVSAREVGALAALYAVVGALHWAVRRPLLEISLDPHAAARAGRAVRLWDCVFYGSFAVVVTSSVRVAGVLLVFAYLVVPAAVAALVARSVAGRLAIGWALGALVSAAGLWASYAWDLPTGATVVSAFGVAIAAVALVLGLRAAVRAVRERGLTALAPAATVASAVVALGGTLLAVFPAMDHPWLDGSEQAVPAIQEAFLTSSERATRRDTVAALARDRAELTRLRALAHDVQWGAKTLDAEHEARLKQFLAGRSEISAGDRLVLHTLRDKARERQRYWLGLPLAIGGAAYAGLALRRRDRP